MTVEPLALLRMFIVSLLSGIALRCRSVRFVGLRCDTGGRAVR